MTQTLVLAGHQQPLQCKVVTRPGPVLPAPSLTLEMLAGLQDHLDGPAWSCCGGRGLGRQLQPQEPGGG